MLLWVDLETTGLEPDKEDVLEIAAIVTRDDLAEVATFERVVHSPKSQAVIDALGAYGIINAEQFRALPEKRPTGAAWDGPTQDLIASICGVDPYVIAMHLENGLWEASRRGENIATVDADFKKFVEEHGVETVTKTKDDGTTKTYVNKPQLAGSTISFDRAFLKKHFPRTTDEKAGVLHYRNCDVTTFNEVARRFWKKVHDDRPRGGDKAAHRGMADIQESLAVLKHYVASLAPRPLSYVGDPPFFEVPLNVTCDAGGAK